MSMEQVTNGSERQPAGAVSSRCVVYISGFDPRGSSFYHGLFVREMAKHSEKHGLALEVGSRKRWGKHWHEWTTTIDQQGNAKSVHFLFLGFDDIIRRNWLRSRPALFLRTCGTYFAYIRTGGLLHLMRTTWYTSVLVLVPVIGFIAIYLVLMSGLGAALIGLAGWLLDAGGVMAAVAGGIGALAGALVAHQLTPFLGGSWMMRSLCFHRRLAERPLPELDERLDRQAEDLLGVLERERPDELLVVAHSSGAILVFPLLDRLLKADAWHGRVSLLTLGQCIPLTSFVQPPDGALNVSMRRVATHPQLDWIDFSMPSDMVSCALLDPVRATFKDAVTYPQPDLPKFLSPRFMEGYSEARYKELKRNRFMFHFLYFMSPDRPMAFDFPTIVLGDQRLPERFRDRKNKARNRVS